MDIKKRILMRAFGHPRGILGRLGGTIMAYIGGRQKNSQAIELLGVQPQDRVLEIGFGPGVGIQIMARLVTSGKVFGIDASEEMVKQATARNAAGIRAGRVDLREGSVEHLPFEDAYFDRALAINSMQVWPDAVAGLQEIRRVLKPEGRLVLGFSRHSGQEREGLPALLEEAGFAHIRFADIEDGFCVIATNPDGRYATGQSGG